MPSLNFPGTHIMFFQKKTLKRNEPKFKFWPKLAKPEFSQYVHDVIPVEDPKYSFYNKIREKERVVWEKSSNRVFFGQK